MHSRIARVVATYRACGRVLGVAAVLALTGGCERGHYDVVMSVEGDNLHRELRYTTSHGENEPPPPVEIQEARHLSDVYGVASPNAPPSEIALSGTFTGATPGDVGGTGALQHLQSPLGSAWVYVERFRGSDQPASSLAERQAAADELADIVRDWFRVELRGSADGERVIAFLETDFRTDLRELATYAWLAGAMDDVSGSDSAREHEMLMRIGMYFVERGYFEIQDLPELVQLTWNDTEEDYRATLNRALARRLKVDLSRDEWQFLRSRGAVEQSLNAALRDHAGLREYVRRESPAGAPVMVPASTWVADVSMRAMGLSLGQFDGLSVRWNLEQAPFRTNGEWKPDEQCVAWNRRLPLRDGKSSPPLPAFLYAEWSAPDAEFQQAHFGKTVLEGQALFEYCAWHAALADDQRQAWDAFVATLTPGPQLPDRIRGFAFPPSRQTPPVVVTPPDVLIEALTPM